MKEVICNIVQDLLPNYSEELTSPETSAVIEEHLETCNECRRLYEVTGKRWRWQSRRR